MTAEQVIDVLADLFVVRGVPRHICSDNGSEFLPERSALLGACGRGDAVHRAGQSVGERLRGVVSRPFAERTFGPEEVWERLEARASGTRYHLEYNYLRPGSALGYRTSAEFSAGSSSSARAASPLQPNSQIP